MSDIFWNSTSSGDWDDATNWLPETVPGAGDNAALATVGFAIAQPYTVTVTASINVDNVVISDPNAVLLDSGPVTVAIADDLTNGGTLDVENGGSTAIGGALTSSGVINITGGSSALSTLSVGAAAPSTLTGTINLTGNALLEYASGGVGAIGSGADLTFSGSQARVAVATGSTTASSALTGLSTNDGVFELEDDATVALTGVFTNAGTVQSFTGATAVMAEVINSDAFDVANGGSVKTTGDFDNTASIDVDNSDGQSGGVLTIGGTLTNSGSLNIGTNVENGSTTVNVEGVDGVNNTGTIDLSDDRSPGSTNQATLDVANAAAGFGAAGQVTGTVSLVGDSLIEFASGGITQVDAGASLSLAGGESRLAIIGTNTNDNTALSGLAENDGAFSVADDATVTTTVDLNNTANIYVDNADGESGATLTIGGTLTNSGRLNIGTNVESGSTTVNVEGVDGVNNTGTIDLSDDRSPRSTNQATLDVANAAAGFGVVGHVTGTVTLVGDSLIEFASGGITQVDAGASLSLAGGESRLAIIGTNTNDNTALNGLAENDGVFSVADDATVTTTVGLNNTANIYVDNADGESGATLTIGGTLTNSGRLNIGTNVESGSTTVNVEGVGGVNNTGTINLSDDRSPGSTNQATLDVANAAAGFGVAGQVTGTVSLVGDSLIEFASGGITQVDAGASLSLAGGESRVAIAGTNTNDNTALSGLAENDGAISVADDATVTTTGDLNNTANIYVDSADGESGGVLTIGGTLTNSGALNMGTNVESGSTTVNVEGVDGVDGVDNTGTIDLSDDRSPGSTNQATLDVVNAAAGFGVVGHVTGTVTLVGDSLIEFATGNIVKIDSGATLSLDGAESRLAIASINTDDNSGLFALTGNAGNFFVADGATVTTISGIDNTGTIGVDLADGQHGGVLTIGGTLTNQGTFDIGQNVENGTTTATIEGDLDNSGSLYAVNSGNSSGADDTVLDVSGLVTNTGALTFGNGVEAQFGGLDNSRTMTLSGSFGVPTTLSVTDDATNSGSLNVEEFSELGIAGAFTDSGALTLGGTIDTAGGFEVTATGALTLQGGTILSPNSAALALDAGSADSGYGAITVATVNDSTLTASGGLLDISAPVTGSGQLAIGSGGELELGAATAQTVGFGGNVGALKLDHPDDLTGAISGLVVNDAIDLAGVQATSAVVNGSTLTVTAGAQTYNYQVSGSGLATNTFALEDDQHGGTDLVLGPPGPTISSPDSQTAFLNYITVLGPLTIADPNAGSGLLTVTITSQSGLLFAFPANGGSVSGFATNKLTLTGDLADINTMLASVLYGGFAAGAADNVQIAVTDANQATAAQTIAVTTDTVPFTTPALNVPATAHVIVGVPTGIGSVSVSDPYASTTGEQIAVGASSKGGAISLTQNSGATITGQNTQSVAVAGTLDQINSDEEDGWEYVAAVAFIAILAYEALQWVKGPSMPFGFGAQQAALNTNFFLNSLPGQIANLFGVAGKIPVRAAKNHSAYKNTGSLANQLDGIAAAVSGHTHLVTFSGLTYEFNPVGEFVLSRSTQLGDRFQVQARLQTLSGSSSVSSITEIAAEVGDDRVTFEADRADPVGVDGAAATVDATHPLTLAGGQISQTGLDTYSVSWNTGETLIVVLNGSSLGVSIYLGPNDAPGSIAGLLGGDEGQADDFMLPDGTVLRQPLTTAELYGDFANAWRVTQSTSLFDYASGQTTASFTDTSFPRSDITLSDLPANIVAAAAQVVAAAGITDAGAAAATEFDFIATGGNPNAIVSNQSAFDDFSTTQAAISASSPAPTVLGVFAPVSAVQQSASGSTDVTFDVYLTAPEATATTVDYAVVDTSDDDFTAAAFGGALPTGLITIAAGQTTGAITIAVLQGALGDLPSEDVALRISSPGDDVPVFAPASLEAVTQATATAPSTSAQAVPELEYLGTIGTFSGSGDDYTLNLGDIQLGEALPLLQFAIANANAAPGDSLTGSFTWATVAGFINSIDGDDDSGASLTAPIGAGMSDQAIAVGTVEDKFGAQDDVITFTPVDTNASGYSKQLSPITLTITDTLEVPGMIYSQAWGDVHIITYNGLQYNFQAAGEFTLAKSNVADDSFDIQLRLQPYMDSSSVTLIQQVASSVGDDRVTFGLTGVDRAAAVLVNGKVTTLSMADPMLALAGGTVTEVSATLWKVDWNTGETMTVTATTSSNGPYFNVSDSVPDASFGEIEGLQGWNEGVDDDFQLPNGTILKQPLTTAELYGEYADAWRVTQATSLFDYLPGQSTATFTAPDFPFNGLTLDDLPATVVANAAALVKAAGITDAVTAENAELDYIATGDPSFISSAANVNQQVTDTVAPTITPSSTPTAAIGVEAEATSVTEAASGETAVTFTAYLTATETTATTVDWAVTAPNADDLPVSAFGGTFPTGSVSIAAGQTTAQFTVDVPQGALGALPDETLVADVSSPDDAVPIFAPTAQTEIVNDQSEAGNPAVPELAYLGHDGSFTYDDTTHTYTLNLGGVTQGASINAEEFAVVNAADDVADNLDGAFTDPTGEGFTVSGDNLPSPLATGESYDGLYISVNTADLGVNGMSLTFNPEDVNDSGYSQPLTPLTLKIVDTVVAAAKPQINTPTTIIFPAVHVGATLSQHVSVSNTAASGAADLDVSLSASASATASGKVTDLAPGATDASDLTVGLDTATAGALSGSVTEAFTSDGGGGNTSPIAEQTPYIDVFGSVYRLADPSISPNDLTVHVGDSGSRTLTITNLDADDNYSENLIATVVGTTGALTVSGTTTGDIKPQADGALGVQFSTSAPGQIGSVTLDLKSDGAGIDGLGETDLGDVTVPIVVTSGPVPAAAQFEEVSGGGAFTQQGSAYTLDLGAITSPATVSLGVLNSALAPADALSGSFKISGDDNEFVNSGFTAFSNVVSGQADTAPTVTLNTGLAGAFSETITLDPIDAATNASLPVETLTIIGSVSAATPAPVITAPANLTVPLGTASALTGVSVADANAGASLTVTLSDFDGLLSATTSATGGGGEISGAGATKLSIAGTLAQVNADLTTLTDTDGAAVDDAILVEADDSFGGRATPATIAVTVSSSPVATATVTINPVDGDNVINNAAANAAGGVALNGAVSGAAAHSTFNVSVVDGSFSKTYTATVDTAGTGWTATIPESDAVTLPNGAAMVTATLSSSVTASETVTVAETPPTVTFAPVDGNNVITGADANAAGGVPLSGSVSGLAAGATFSVSVVQTDPFSKTYTATVDSAGTGWTATIPESDAVTLSDGTATLSTQVTDAFGNVSAPATDTVTVSETPPTVTIAAVDGDNVITNAEAHAAAGVALSGTVSGLAAGATFTVTVTDGGFDKTYTATVNAAGNGWTATLPEADAITLANGTATVTAQVTNAFGVSSTIASDNFTVSIALPLAPVITAPANGSQTSNVDPPITGTGAAGDTVTVSIDGSVAGTTTVAANDSWTFTPRTPLATGKHSVIATQTDAFGNVSLDSATDTFAIAKSGTGTGDVHMLTYDGLHYDFQADGSYVLTQSTVPGDDFEIQIQTAPYAANNATSLITAVAAQLGSDIVAFDAAAVNPLIVNGVADTALNSPGQVQTFAAGELVELSPTDFQVDWNTGETLFVDDAGVFFNTSVTLGPSDGPGSVQGLLGPDTGQANDIELPNGTVLSSTSTQQLLGEYAQAWSVAPDDSLFGSITPPQGGLDIISGQTVSLGDASSYAVTFTNTGGTVPTAPSRLILTAAQDFTGSVAGLAFNDSIDLFNFDPSHSSITAVNGTGARGTYTDVTIIDADPADAHRLSVTLQLLNQYANQFGVNPHDYSLGPDHMSNGGALFQLAAR